MHTSQSLFYLTTAQHVSGLTITHLQEHKTTEIQLNYIHSLILSVVRLTTGTKLFHNEFSTEGDLVFPLSASGTIVSLRSFIICLRLIPRLPVNSILPATFSTRTYLIRQFPWQCVEIQLAFFLFIVLGNSFSSRLYAIILHFAHNESNLIVYFLVQHHV